MRVLSVKSLGQCSACVGELDRMQLELDFSAVGNSEYALQIAPRFVELLLSVDEQVVFDSNDNQHDQQTSQMSAKLTQSVQLLDGTKPATSDSSKLSSKAPSN